MVEKKRRGSGLAKRLGSNIAARRKARKWSQEDLAEHLGLASETISRFERGATLPSLTTLERLGKALKSPISDLLAESSTSPDDQAEVIASWISDLADNEREFALDLVKKSCDFFRKRA